MAGKQQGSRRDRSGQADPGQVGVFRNVDVEDMVATHGVAPGGSELTAEEEEDIRSQMTPARATAGPVPGGADVEEVN